MRRLTEGTHSFWKSGITRTPEEHVETFANHVFADNPQAAKAFAHGLNVLGKMSSVEIEGKYQKYVQKVKAAK